MSHRRADERGAALLAREEPSSALGWGLRAHEICGLSEETVDIETRSGVARARLAIAGGYSPRIGDRVLVGEGEGGALYVLGVLRALRPADLLGEAADGTTITRAFDEEGVASLIVRAPDNRVIVEIREADGRILVHGSHAGLELRAGEGPLTLASDGEVRIEGRRGVSVRTERRVRIETGTAAEATHFSLDAEGARLRAREVELEATVLRLTARRVLRVATESLETTAKRIRQRAETAEIEVVQLVERIREAYREVEELAQTRAGEIRLVAREALRALAQHAHLKAREDIKLRAEKNIYLD